MWYDFESGGQFHYSKRALRPLISAKLAVRSKGKIKDDSRPFNGISEKLSRDMSTESQKESTPIRSSGAIKHRRIQLPWPEDKEFRILSIDGGGIKGIFPAAFLSGLEERYLRGDSIARHFDLIAGTSTGGIIALGLGAGLTAAELRDLYIHRGCEIFPPRSPMVEPLAKLLQLVKFRYNRAALMNVLSDTFSDRKFGESNARLCIPSCDGRHSEVYIFKTPHHPDYRLDGTEK